MKIDLLKFVYKVFNELDYPVCEIQSCCKWIVTMFQELAILLPSIKKVNIVSKFSYEIKYSYQNASFCEGAKE